MRGKGCWLSSDPFTVAYMALLQPSRFAAWLQQGHAAILAALLTTMLWTVALAMLVLLILPQITLLNVGALLLALVFITVFSSIFAGMFMMGNTDINTSSLVCFWFVRSQLTMLPFILWVAGTLAPGDLPMLFAGTTLVAGYVLGDAVSVKLLRISSYRQQSGTVRFILTSGLVMVGGMLCWPLLVNDIPNALAFTLFFGGLILGLTQLLPWLCYAPLSLVLALAVRAGLPA
ncbi:MAG: hypothetical protein HC837_18335, partial [Chloroflexaceae bacterium]|nr:hypothetical protein [Chloroflexaceae bacterium]